MGVKDLTKFIKARAPAAIRDINSSELPVKCVGIDVPQWILSNLRAILSSATPKDVIEHSIDRTMVLESLIRNFSSRIQKLLRSKILPIFIFEGTAPPEKDITRSRRREERESNRKLMNELNAELSAMIPALRPSDKIVKLRDLTSKLYYFNEYELQAIRTFLHSLGIPCIQATEEAERTASILCREGILGGVMTTDSDVLAHGADYLITDVGDMVVDPLTGAECVRLSIIHLPTILQTIGFTKDMWRDFCIMCGTDYGPNISGIASIKAHDLIKQHTTINNIPDPRIMELNFERQRELFKYIHSSKMIQPVGEQPLIPNFSPETLMSSRDALNGLGLDKYIQIYLDFYLLQGLVQWDQGILVSTGLVKVVCPTPPKSSGMVLNLTGLIGHSNNLHRK